MAYESLPKIAPALFSSEQDLIEVYNKKTDTVGVINPSQISTPLPSGVLSVDNPLSSTLQPIEDKSGTASALSISTNRVGLASDPSVTTQNSSVIAADTANASLVIAPNGTGALIADIPNGTATGGNARGTNAVDLQTVRVGATQVASGSSSVISGGEQNRSSNAYSTVSGGFFNNATGSAATVVGGNGNTSSGDWSVSGGVSNNATGQTSVVFGGANTASSQYSTVSGGQSNTASSGTHATVVGGSSNTSSGQYSVSGGWSNTSSGQNSATFGRNCVASGVGSFAAGYFNQATATASTAIGGSFGLGNRAGGTYSFSIGYSSSSYLTGQHSLNSIIFTNNGDSQQSLLTANREATLTTGGTTVLSLDGTGTTNLIIPSGNNRLWAVKVVATAFVSVAGGTLVLGDSYMGEFTLLFKRVGGTSSVVGVNSANLIYDTNMATAAFTFAAGASQDLQITFKAPTTASATTFRCVAKVELVEVAY